MMPSKPKLGYMQPYCRINMAGDSELSALEGHDGSQAEMMAERCILVDTSGNSIGSETKLNCHYGEGNPAEGSLCLTYLSVCRTGLVYRWQAS